MTTADIARLLTQAAHIWDTAANTRPTVTADDDWAGYWGERRKEERALPHTDPREDDRTADNYYLKRRGA